MMRTVMALALFVFMASAFGQQEGAGTPSTASAIPPGIYNGRVHQQGGSLTSDFDLDLRKNPGTLRMHRASKTCTNEPINIVSSKDGVVRLETKEGPLGGCDRIIELTISGNEISGTMVGPLGKFDVKGKKQ